jgi:hypothetical protein
MEREGSGGGEQEGGRERQGGREGGEKRGMIESGMTGSWRGARGAFSGVRKGEVEVIEGDGKCGLGRRDAGTRTALKEGARDY